MARTTRRATHECRTPLLPHTPLRFVRRSRGRLHSRSQQSRWRPHVRHHRDAHPRRPYTPCRCRSSTTNIGTADPPASGPALPQKSGTGLLIATRQRAADREKSSASGTCISGVPTSVHWRRPPPLSRNTSRKRNRPPKTSNWGCTPMIWGCGTCGTRGSVQSGWDAILAAAGGADDLPRPRRHGKPTVYPLPVVSPTLPKRRLSTTIHQSGWGADSGLSGPARRPPGSQRYGGIGRRLWALFRCAVKLLQQIWSLPGC